MMCITDFKYYPIYLVLAVVFFLLASRLFLLLHSEELVSVICFLIHFNRSAFFPLSALIYHWSVLKGSLKLLRIPYLYSYRICERNKLRRRVAVVV